ncbi:glycoside hydrolase superfamily, partial [Endogone sp. FLAS-F59071]
MGRLGQLFVLAAALVGAVAGAPKVHQKDMVVLGYWSGECSKRPRFNQYWTNDVYPATYIPWKKLTHVNYAFIVFGEDFVMQTSCDSTFSVPKNCTDGHKILKDLVEDGHKHGVKVQASVGGCVFLKFSSFLWDGSQYFSYAVGSPANVTKIVNNFVKLVKDFDLDGIDIDW